MPTNSCSIIIRWFCFLVTASTVALASRTAIAQPAGGRMSFTQLDKNGDGKIDRAEFPGPEQAFGRIDTNGDGFISQEEFANRPARGSGGGQRLTPTGGGPVTGRAGRSEQDLAAVRADLGKPAADQKITVPEGVKFIADLTYREGNPMWKLDLAMPADGGTALRPGIVFVHGGGWRGGDKRQGYFLQGALDYARRGYVCITVNYRLTGESPFPACVEDVKTAVRWFRAHAKDYNLDPERIGAYGNSAGAHLVAMLGLAGPEAKLEGDGPWKGFSSAVQAVCPSAVPVDFVNWGGPRGVYRGESTLFAGPAETLEERKRLGSPITHVSPQAPPFLVIHGTADGVVPFSQAEALVAALKRAGASVTFMPIEGAGHGVFVEHAATTKPAMEEFFDRHLKRGSARANSAPKEGARPRDQTPSWLMPEVKGPNLHYETFDSKAAGQKVSYLLYLPPEYESSGARRYPVVYWLHVIGGAQTGVPLMAERLTKAIADGKIPPMLVVYVNGMIRSSYVDSADGKTPVETVTIKELIPHIDATYRTIATREGRMVEGFSMGGSGAAKWGFKHRDLFGSISIIDGALHSSDDATGGKMGDSFKTIYGGDKVRFAANDPWKLAEENADKMKGRTVIRIVTRTVGLGGANEKFHELLDRLGLEHEFYKIPGAPHSPNPLYEGLGDRNWPFYVKAFKDAKPAK
ncbi:MAG: hypothetical protein FJ399_04815 [Verrucomicrobia bacterium]|nr:hypothetical protein [Verrucomicrobiota bacterium]